MKALVGTLNQALVGAFSVIVKASPVEYYVWWCDLLAIPGGDDGDILSYDAIDNVWDTVDRMRVKRNEHAVAVVDRDIVEKHCY